MSQDRHDTDLDALAPAIRSGLEAEVDPRLLILTGLRSAGWDEALTPEERSRCEAEQDRMTESLSRHPALDDVVKAVSRDADLFAEIWPVPTAPKRADRSPRRIEKQRSVLRWPARIGLGISSLVLVTLMISSLFDGVRRTTITADAGAPMEVALNDGSTARLAPGASLSFVPGQSFDRSVDLSGSAFFDIRPDSRRFSVSTPHAVVSVLGTRFGVQVEDEATEVVLVSGKVAVASRENRKAPVVLEPGQRTRVDAGSAPDTPARTDVSTAMPWTDILAFQNTPMSQVATLIGQARDVEVILGEGLSALTVSGTFRPDQSAEEILSILSATLEANLERSSGGFSLSLR